MGWDGTTESMKLGIHGGLRRTRQLVLFVCLVRLQVFGERYEMGLFYYLGSFMAFSSCEWLGAKKRLLLEA